MLLQQAIDEWLLALDAIGTRQTTLSTYRIHVDIMTRRWTDVHDVTSVTPFHVRRFMADYAKSHSPASVKTIFASFRAFINWCLREEIIKSTPLHNIRTPKCPETSKPIYTAGQLKTLFLTLGSNRTPLGMRDAAIVSLFTDTGIRVGELCDLTLSDLETDGLKIRRTKSGKVRPAFLGKRSNSLLIRYLTSGRPRLKPKGEWIFVVKDGKQMCRNAVRLFMDKLSVKLGFHLNPHAFRHSWATIMAAKGAEAMQLMELAGWQDIRQAERYVHLAARDLRELHEKLKPLDGLF